tara:strand:- start:320 stop:1477 length:1158 start_codon:yes stop_codon:yes gene_type:complete
MKVLIRAPLLTVSGYGVHSRQVYSWLESNTNLDIRTQVLNWGDTTWMINPDLEKGMIGRIMSKSGDLDQKFDISFQVQLPDEWDNSLAKVNVGISAFVETDRCNPEWIECVNKMDAVIVPSNHIKRVIENTGATSTDIHVIPEWFFDEVNHKNEELPLEIETKFNFILVGQVTGSTSDSDRKNIFNTIKWFCEAFKDDPDVGLILKTNKGRGTMLDRQWTKDTVKQLLSQVREGPYPKIHMVHGNLTPDEIVSLYKREDVKSLISLTRGEGFGLPLLEAAACGLPVIATNWSAHLDFLSLGKFIPVKYEMCEIPQERIDNRIFFSGMRWSNPSEQDFKKKVVKLRNKYTIPSGWAEELSLRVRSEFSSRAIKKKYDKFLQDLLGE